MIGIAVSNRLQLASSSRNRSHHTENKHLQSSASQPALNPVYKLKPRLLPSVWMNLLPYLQISLLLYVQMKLNFPLSAWLNQSLTIGNGLSPPFAVRMKHSLAGGLNHHLVVDMKPVAQFPTPAADVEQDALSSHSISSERV